MAFLVLTYAEVESLLTPLAAIEIMAEALAALSRGEIRQPLRSVYLPPGAPGPMSWMPAYRAGETAVHAMKLLCVIQANTARGLHAHQGAVLLLDGITGELRAL